MTIDPESVAMSFVISLVVSIVLATIGWAIRALFRRDKARHQEKLGRQQKKGWPGR